MIKIEEILSKTVEPAKTGRSKCKICNNTIEKNSLRVGISYAETSGMKWHHLVCFPIKEIISEVDALNEELVGYATLNETEQNAVKDQMNVTIAPIRSAGGDKFIEPRNFDDLDENDKNEILAIKSKIEEIKTVTAEKLRELLNENLQYSAGTKGELLIRAADCIVRGAIPKCSQCGNGILYWSEATQDYFCKGYAEEENYVKCEAIFPKDKINRTNCVIPETFWQKKERKRKVTSTTVVEQVVNEQQNEIEDDNKEESTGKRKRVRKTTKRDQQFIYEDDNSDNQESIEKQHIQNNQNYQQEYQQDYQYQQNNYQQNYIQENQNIPYQNHIPIQQNSFLSTVINNTPTYQDYFQSDN